MIGDFNATLNLDDRKGCTASSLSDNEFQNMIFDCGLQDISYMDLILHGIGIVVQSALINASVMQENRDASLPIVDTIQHFSVVVKTWNCEVFGIFGKNKRILMARFRRVQRSFDQRRTRIMLKLESKLLEELEIILDQEEQLWKQKSCADWIIF
ncbi:hypothetical protein V6N13_017021 [Hibiscus sabdariffa]